jgi:hypothetical protein
MSTRQKNTIVIKRGQGAHRADSSYSGAALFLRQR